MRSRKIKLPKQHWRSMSKRGSFVSSKALQESHSYFISRVLLVLYKANEM
jgi:hypothetical protein